MLLLSVLMTMFNGGLLLYGLGDPWFSGLGIAAGCYSTYGNAKQLRREWRRRKIAASGVEFVTLEQLALPSMNWRRRCTEHQSYFCGCPVPQTRAAGTLFILAGSGNAEVRGNSIV
jgi:hypothetical protein